MWSPLDQLFMPQSVAIVGVSATSEREANSIFRNASTGFAGRTFAVGRGGGRLGGVDIYPSIADLPVVPDVVFGSVGQQAAVDAMVEAAAFGVPYGVVFTAGFAEMNTTGADAERRMVRECRKLGMRIVGPNCMGMFHQQIGLNLTPHSQLPARGPLGLVSQSGNIAYTLFNSVGDFGMGFDSFISFGNQADIPVADYIRQMALDAAIQVIVVYLESLQPGHGEAFIRTCREVSRRVPIVCLKGGLTDGGRRAAASHTARMSASADVYAAALTSAGVIQVDSLENVLPVVEAILRCPRLAGNSVAIVGSGGGHSTTSTDQAELHGMKVTPFPPGVVSQMKEHLPEWAPVNNPVDMTGVFVSDLTLFPRLMGAALSDPAYAGGLCYGLYGEKFVPDLVDDNGFTFVSAAPLLGQLQLELNKPIVFYTPYAKEPGPEFTALRSSGVPCFGSLEHAAAALAALRAAAHSERLSAKPPAMPESSLRDVDLLDDAGTLTEAASLRLLSSAGIPIVDHRTVRDPEAAVIEAAALGYPVVIKAQLKDVAHKADVGGVRLGLATASAVRSAVVDMHSELAEDGDLSFSVARQLTPERELIVGARRDEVFGCTALVGIGGTLTEVIDQHVVVVPPTSADEFADLLESSSFSAYLKPWRGAPAVDLGALYDLVCRVIGLVSATRRIQEIDLNPVFTIRDRLVAVDASVTVAVR